VGLRFMVLFWGSRPFVLPDVEAAGLESVCRNASSRRRALSSGSLRECERWVQESEGNPREEVSD
jgi:hypothetical protein